jgi:N-acetyl sugar amidotransferase
MYRLCANCVMDTSDPAITFDAKGVCDHCRTFYKRILPRWRFGEGRERELQSLAETIRASGKGRHFDCIVGISGGVDSSYLTYLAKSVMGLRPLVFHVDTGWNSQESVRNIEVLLDSLGLELYTEVIDWEEMRDLQLAFFKSGVPHIDTPQDHAIFASMYKFAARHDVKYILTGANYSTECIRNPVEWMYYQSDSSQLRDIHRRFGTKPLRKFPTTSILWHKVYLPYVKGIKVVKPLNYVRYVRGEAAQLLKDKFGWEPYGEKHYESRFTRFYESYWLYERFGWDVRRVKYSSLILTGQMKREEALEKLAQPPYEKNDIIREKDYIAKKLGISCEELDRYMDIPRRSYRDYRNQAWLYSLGASVARALRLELGGKR